MDFRYIYYILLILCLSCSKSYDIGKKKDFKIIDKYDIQFEYSYFFHNDDSLLYDIFYKVPYSELVFNKQKTNFISKFIVDIVVDDGTKIIFSDSFEKEVEVDYFEHTHLVNNDFFYYELLLPKMGENNITLTINDYENHKFWNYSSKLNADDYQFLSKISFYNKIDEKYFHINNNSLFNNTDTLWMKYQIIDNSIEDINCELFEFGKLIKTINIPREKLENKLINYLPLDIKEFNRKIKVYIKYKDILREETINIYGNNNKDLNFSDLIGPIEYLFNRKEYIHYSGLDSSKKVDYIKEYWDNKFNDDLLYEFFNRVEYANSQYPQMRTEGWMSDRGRIYILHGKPLRISHDFSDQGEFEIWSYKYKKFIFKIRFGIYECYICS